VSLLGNQERDDGILRKRFPCATHNNRSKLAGFTTQFSTIATGYHLCHHGEWSDCDDRTVRVDAGNFILALR
jgi:hypothetical protein